MAFISGLREKGIAMSPEGMMCFLSLLAIIGLVTLIGALKKGSRL